MKVRETKIDGAFVITPDVHFDSRGYFTETFNQEDFNKIIPDVIFVQDNQSHSAKNVLRGLHFQKGEFAQAKLVRCTEGIVYDVAVDLGISATAIIFSTIPLEITTSSTSTPGTNTMGLLNLALLSNS